MKDRVSNEGLTVEAVYDLRWDAGAQAVYAQTFLNALSEAEWTELREAATRTGKTDNPVLRCGDCRKAVYARESWKGRRHCYHFASDHSDCRWSGAVARNRRSIDAEKFHGQQEGERHKNLKQLIAEVLALDAHTRTAGIACERYTKRKDGRYGYPDVYAHSWQGAPAAFEIQLATTHLPVILEREEFYENGGIRLAWVVDHHTKSLSRRAFRDIYMRNDGQIFGMDSEVAETARQEMEPRFRLYRLLPGPAHEGFVPQWQDRIVSSAEIDWGSAGTRPRSAGPSYDSYLDQKIERDGALKGLREQFYDALKAADEDRASKFWDEAAKVVGGISWSALPSPDDTVRALGVLATLRTNSICVPTIIPLSNLPKLVNSMLLEPHERRCWTHAFELLCRAKGLNGLLNQRSVQAKCNRNRAKDAFQPPIDRAARAVFNVFFPDGAFHRLTLDGKNASARSATSDGVARAIEGIQGGYRTPL